jgi:hypothetical protein
MSFRLGLQLASVATTMGAGDPFVPTNLDFIDWEDRGAEFVAVNGRPAKQIRQDYHALFETGLLDPFKNGSCLFFAGVTFDTCFIPAVARNFDEPVDNAGFVAGNHFPDGLQGTGSAYINTELGFLAGQRNNHSAIVYLSDAYSAPSSAEVLLGSGDAESGAVALSLSSTKNRTFTRSSGATGQSADVGSVERIYLISRTESTGYDLVVNNFDLLNLTRDSVDILLDNVWFFARSGGTPLPSNRRLACAAFGDAHPDPTGLRTALNDLFIDKMGIAI